MNLKTKKILDETLGDVVLKITNALAWTLGKVLNRNHAFTPVKKILILKFQGMGSLAIAKPYIADLRQKFPDAKILFWGTPGTCVLAKEMPEFDEVFTLDDRKLLGALSSIVKVLRRLIQYQVDWCFDLEVYSKVSPVLATLSCSRNRAGFVLNFVRHRQGAFTHLIYFNRYVYLGRAYQLLFNSFNSTHDSPSHLLPIRGAKWRFTNERLPSRGKPYIVLNIHAGDLSLERKWPLSSFEALASKLLDKYPGNEIILIGKGRYEESECERFFSHDRIVNLSGKLSLSETIRLLAHSELVVSNDTAPLHLALSTNSPVIGLFGPTRWQTYFPENTPWAAALHQGFYCSPCVHHWDPPLCRGDNQCMKSLSVDTVFNQCIRMLEKQSLQLMITSEPSHRGFKDGLVYSCLSQN